MGQIIIKQGDITEEDVDAIVNAANTSLRGGGGVDGAIHRCAGPAVLAECIKIGHCPTGEAVMTNAGRLKARRIIHTVGPVYNRGQKREADLLQSCYRNCFELAAKNNLKSIAFPAISTGAYRYPIEEAARIALGEGLKSQNSFTEIRFVCFTKTDLGIYQKLFDQLTDEPTSRR